MSLNIQVIEDDNTPRPGPFPKVPVNHIETKRRKRLQLQSSYHIKVDSRRLPCREHLACVSLRAIGLTPTTAFVL
jgi:hypothetical protein